MFMHLFAWCIKKRLPAANHGASQYTLDRVLLHAPSPGPPALHPAFGVALHAGLSASKTCSRVQ